MVYPSSNNRKRMWIKSAVYYIINMFLKIIQAYRHLSADWYSIMTWTELDLLTYTIYNPIVSKLDYLHNNWPHLYRCRDLSNISQNNTIAGRILRASFILGRITRLSFVGRFMQGKAMLLYCRVDYAHQINLTPTSWPRTPSVAS